MRLSKIGMTNTKLTDINPMFPAQEILLQSNQMMQYASGVFALNTIPLKVKHNIEKIIRKKFNSAGLVEVMLPTLHPKEIWVESGRWDNYIRDGVMLYTESNKGTFALSPTAEEAMITFVKDNISSHKQLPFTYYQIGEKYRNEIRNRGYLMRGKVFTMMDAYSFNLSEEDLNTTYMQIRQLYLDIFDEIGLNVIPVVADNGSMGGKKSEEFMLIADSGEDTILYNKELNIGLNTEILEKENYADYLLDNYGIQNLDNFEEKRAIELGHIFSLGTFYSEKMNLKFADKDEKIKNVYMGCYGIGVTRLLATIYEQSILEDKKGISLPLSVAPFVAQIVYTDSKKDFAEKLYETLLQKNIPVIIDDRQDKKIGFGAKINTAKLLGTPYICKIGDKIPDGYIELEDTKTNENKLYALDEFVAYLQNLCNM